MIETCGRVYPMSDQFMKIKFVGEEEEKVWFKDWKHCPKEVAKGKHLCAEHLAKPITVEGKLFLGVEKSRMKPVENNPPVWPLLFINPISFIVIMMLCFTHCESCYSACSDPLPPNKYKIDQIGTIASGNEICKIEEVVETHYYYGGAAAKLDGAEVDKVKKCTRPLSSKRPIARRINCPSGISTSLITHDNTKFHKELVE